MGDRAVRIVLALVCAAILIPPVIWGGGDDPVLPPSPVRHTETATEPVGAAIAAALPRREAAPKLPGVPAAARRAAAKMPVDQLAGQVLMVGFRGADRSAGVFDEIRHHGWGGVVITTDNALTVAQVGTLARYARSV